MTAKPLKIVFVGDVAFPEGEGVPSDPFGDAEEHLLQAELVVANLEGPVSRNSPARTNRTALLSNDKEILKCFQKYRQTALCLANNHIMDFGPQALIDTLQAAKQHNLTVFGAGVDQAEAERLAVVQCGETRIGLLGLTTEVPYVGSICARGAAAGSASLDDADQMLASVRAAARSVDVLCVVLHWGYEFFQYPTPEQVSLAQQMINCGAKLVVGHHPHVLQGVVKYNGGVICHSLGNFYFPPVQSSTTGRYQIQAAPERCFGILEVVLEGHEVSSFRLVGGELKGRRLSLFRGSRLARFQAGMTALSEPLLKVGYSSFWASYDGLRRKQLKRQQLVHAVRKVGFRDIRKLSAEDFGRQLSRLRAVLWGS